MSIYEKGEGNDFIISIGADNIMMLMLNNILNFQSSSNCFIVIFANGSLGHNVAYAQSRGYFALF